MDWSTFLALLARDAHVARSKLAFMLVQNLFRPLLLAFVVGRILTVCGMEVNEYKTCCCLAPCASVRSYRVSGEWPSR